MTCREFPHTPGDIADGMVLLDHDDNEFCRRQDVLRDKYCAIMRELGRQAARPQKIKAEK